MLANNNFKKYSIKNIGLTADVFFVKKCFSLWLTILFYVGLFACVLFSGTLFAKLFKNPFKIEKEKLERAVKLKTIGYLGSAKNKFSFQTCTNMGIVVFDDPKSNPRSATFIPKRVIDFMNKGTTYMSSNFPNLQLPAIDKSHRLIHIHKNVPGIMAQINTIFAKHNINIVGQFLMTNATLGYAITDINAEYDKQLFKSLKKIENTIKFRVLY